MANWGDWEVSELLACVNRCFFSNVFTDFDAVVITHAKI